MFTLRIENQKGQEITLTQNESEYQVIDVEGLNPPKANIFTNAVANMDGQKFKSSKLEMRNIVLTIKVNGHAEENRINLYSYFRIGGWCKIYYKNGSRDIYVEGYCETIECPLFTMNQQMQVSIICPDPYLKSVDVIMADLSKVLGLFVFPFAIEKEGVPFASFDQGRVTTILNSGELATGLTIRLIATDNNISNPIIYNVNTGEFMSIDTILNKGNEIIINTNKGQKSITKIVDGTESNIINSLNGSSTWLQLDAGTTDFTYGADNNDEKLLVIFEYNHRYEGV